MKAFVGLCGYYIITSITEIKSRQIGSQKNTKTKSDQLTFLLQRNRLDSWGSFQANIYLNIRVLLL